MRERVIDPANHTEYGSLSEFLEAGPYPPGVLSITQRGLPIDIWNDFRGHDVTIVFFNAAISRRVAQLPVFVGDGISKDVPANRVFVNDPSTYLHPRLGLAWYAGNRKQYLLQGVLKRILKALIPDGQRVVTFGPSGGGFAALYYATEFPGAIAIPVNPQTNVHRYDPYGGQVYAERAWGLTGDDAAAKIPATLDVVSIYAKPVQNRVWYVQNTGDSTHMENQYKPFMEALHPRNVVHPVLTYAGEGHVPPAKPIIRDVLSAAATGAMVPPVVGT